jgi:hypothetical protein
MDPNVNSTSDTGQGSGPGGTSLTGTGNSGGASSATSTSGTNTSTGGSLAGTIGIQGSQNLQQVLQQALNAVTLQQASKANAQTNPVPQQQNPPQVVAQAAPQQNQQNVEPMDPAQILTNLLSNHIDDNGYWSPIEGEFKSNTEKFKESSKFDGKNFAAFKSLLYTYLGPRNCVNLLEGKEPIPPKSNDAQERKHYVKTGSVDTL